jgi:hypothetical protein
MAGLGRAIYGAPSPKEVFAWIGGTKLGHEVIRSAISFNN